MSSLECMLRSTYINLICEHKFGFRLCFDLSWCPVFVNLSACLAYVIYSCEYYSFHFQVISEVDLRYTTV